MASQMLPGARLDVLFSAEEIAARVAEMAVEIAAVIDAGRTTALVVLRGAVPFSVDLLRALAVDLPVTYCAASSYREGTARGDVRLNFFAPEELRGNDVLLIEDIVDTGHTLLALHDALLREHGAAKVTTVSLLDKPGRREAVVAADYIGFTVAADAFVVGYGLDLDGKYRSLPYLAVPA